MPVSTLGARDVPRDASAVRRQFSRFGNSAVNASPAIPRSHDPGTGFLRASPENDHEAASDSSCMPRLPWNRGRFSIGRGRRHESGRQRRVWQFDQFVRRRLLNLLEV